MNVAPQPASFRVGFYSHDSVGFGHLRRNLALAHSMASGLPELLGRDVTGLIITGEERAAMFARPAGFDLLVLPSISKTVGAYQPRHLDIPFGELVGMREGMLTALMVRSQPDLMVIDRHPFGIDGELREPLRALRRAALRTGRPVKIVLGLRDVLDEPAALDREWASVDTAEVRELFDEIWVYGDPRVHNVLDTGEVPAELAPMVRYLGLLAVGRPRSFSERTGKRYLATMVGAGSDGVETVLAAAAAAVPKGYRHIVVTGPQMDRRAHEQVRSAAHQRCVVRESIPDGNALLRGAAAAVIMGGYNSVCEVLASQVPALVVPRVIPRLEQAIRADALAAVGAVDVMRPDQLSAAALGHWFDQALRNPRAQAGARSKLDLRGLNAVVHRVGDLFASGLSSSQEAATHV